MRKKIFISYIMIILFLGLTIFYFITNSSIKILINAFQNESDKQIILISDIISNSIKNELSQDEISNIIASYNKELDCEITINTTIPKRKTNLNKTTIVSNKKININGKEYYITLSKTLLELTGLKNDYMSKTLIVILLCCLLSIIFAIYYTNIITLPIYDLIEHIRKEFFSYKKIPDKNKNDQVRELSSVYKTINKELKNFAIELRNKNIELNTILYNMSDGIIALDKYDTINLINPKAIDILNINPECSSDCYFYNTIKNKQLIELVELNNNCTEEITISTSNGKKTINVSISNVNLPESKISSIILLQDISKIRKLEQVRSDFVSNVTHELKTPLTSIIGFIDTLKYGAINNKDISIKFLDIIKSEANRLSLLINDILSLSEIESREEDSNIYPNNINDTIEHTVHLLEKKANDKNIKINYELGEDIPILNFNSDRISQVFINLIDNAIKYTDSGLITIKSEFIKNNIKITISDTGIGISKKHLDKIFQRFYRVDKGRSRKVGGTGLGLSIVKHVIQLYKGTINVTSEVGYGTTFVITLPNKL